ncbi:MAG: tRNA (adenosine(37)-N6)-threonylcarbamoyltransferase complex transferase subunit TsaD [Tenericutes bacterium]|nr:MAG: tRNA (adenosine(37)-N6)-threonylcarbamoyltransferase complex transferase subunit TsaD [Mycoplasmatota bacterium]
MKFLAIETSCDDTSISIMDGYRPLSLITHSQVETHNQFGGVIPELASRLHSKNIFSLIETALEDANVSIEEIEAVSVTKGPGLINTLQIGITVAKTLSQVLEIPLYGINHLEAHMYSPFIGIPMPLKKSIVVIASGGHTIIGTLINNETKIYGESLDDAIGETFDKVGKMMGLSYPAGPIIDSIAKEGELYDDLPKTNLPGYDFSYSGLKSYFNRKIETTSNKELLSFNLQTAAFDQLMRKIVKLSDETGINDIIVGGGVSNSTFFRNLTNDYPEMKFFFPKKKYTGDNAAMIGYTTYLKLQNKSLSKSDLTLDAKPSQKRKKHSN